MSRILFIGSTLTLGAGAGVGGLAIKTLKSESQVSYQTVSSDNNSEEKEILEEQGGDSDVDLKNQGEVDEGEHDSQVPQSQEEAFPQYGDVSHGQSLPERSSEPAKETCDVYTVISSSSGNRKARLESESFVKNHVKDPSVVKKIEEACEKSKKAYIANPRGGRGWTYRPEDQLGYWKIENNS